MNTACHTPNCDGDVGENSQIGLCTRCYGSIRYWHKKSIKAQIQRQQQLQIFRGRMDLMMPSSTVTMPYRKPKERLAIMPGELKKFKKGNKIGRVA